MVVMAPLIVTQDVLGPVLTAVCDHLLSTPGRWVLVSHLQRDKFQDGSPGLTQVFTSSSHFLHTAASLPCG